MLAAVLALPALARAQIADPIAPPPIPSVALPPELDRVLRDYEKAWQARDAAGLAALFANDGFALSNGSPAARGRPAIVERYASAGGPLALRAYAYATADTVGYIIGGFSQRAGDPDGGKFVLALRRARGGPWQIAADIENTIARQR